MIYPKINPIVNVSKIDKKDWDSEQRGKSQLHGNPDNHF